MTGHLTRYSFSWARSKSLGLPSVHAAAHGSRAPWRCDLIPYMQEGGCFFLLTLGTGRSAWPLSSRQVLPSLAHPPGHMFT